MQIEQIKTTKRCDLKKLASMKIQGFGDANDYPQSVIELVGASVTASRSLDVYRKFIFGKGFADIKNYQLPINDDGEMLDSLLQKCAHDKAHFGGFAIHVNYNALYQIISLYHVPLENVRLCLPNEDGYVAQVAIHPDWGKRYTNIRSFKPADIDYIDLFNPDPAIIRSQVEKAGGWNQYKGQVLYVSNNGPKSYPLPIFDSALIDMNSEEAISNITNRNSADGFLPSCMLVEILSEKPTTEDGKEEPSPTAQAIKDWRGAKKAGNIICASVSSKDELPQVIKFDMMNYDKEFSVSRDACKDSIGRAFSQPPILRAEDVGSNFGSTAMKEAYDFYNSITHDERQDLEAAFTKLMKHWHENVTCDFTIIPLSYDVQTTLAERLGDKFDKFDEMINNASLSEGQKRSRARVLYGLSDEEINGLLL